MKPWTVDPEIVRKVRKHILAREAGRDRIADFEDVRSEVQALADLLIPDAAPVRASILSATSFSVRLGASRIEAARKAYRYILPPDLAARVGVERYVERRTAVASLTSSVDGILGFYDPSADLVCLRAMPTPRLLETAIRAELRRFFRRGMPEPYRSIPEGFSEATSMEHAMAQVVMRRYLDPILRPHEAVYREAEPKTWADVFAGDSSALRVFAGAASRHFLSRLSDHYDFSGAEHLERIESSYVEDAQSVADELRSPLS